MKLGIFSSLQKENVETNFSNNKAPSSLSLFPYIMLYTNYSNLNSTSYSCQHSTKTLLHQFLITMNKCLNFFFQIYITGRKVPYFLVIFLQSNCHCKSMFKLCQSLSPTQWWRLYCDFIFLNIIFARLFGFD